jgi:hypothetical protein
MLRIITATVALLVFASASGHADVPVTLRGSPESMVRQNRIAKQSDAQFLRTPADIHAAVDAGRLVPVEGSEHYQVNRISFPYARPETRLFLERFSEQYSAACGEPLVVTSLTRASSLQPPNAHRLSVHPTGLAVDLRISQSAECRGYLESTLLAMEAEGVLDVTRERTPPHYHVALFPEAYVAYIGEAPGGEPVPGMEGVDTHVQGPASLEAAGAHSLVPTDPAREEASTRTLGGLIGRLLTLPGRLLSRVFGA